MIEVETMQKQEGEASSCHHNHNQVSPSPSFSSYSSETLAEIAARVIEELRLDPHSASSDDTLFQPWVNDDDDDDNNSRNDTTENDDFEFSFVSRDPNSSPVSADDIFYNGQIKPMYPIFDRTLLFDAPTPSNDTVAASVSPVQNTNHDETKRRRLPLRKLMFEEGETASCSSSTDESVELEGVTEGTYCVWTPNSVAMERKKSNSTGSASKRWKLRNLLLRSQSDGKDKQQPVFQIPSNKVAAKPGSGDCDGGASQSKKKSFLPYKPELVGLFANVNGLGRNLRPF
ncbi:uncharacterized protein LOC133308716 [Gastrolobium bilobum]|uniref:uncharacterized protein LOC133308716 n=1 Tax=Gastrolobium bilobum TaxID=150636 RepID=UPI002AAF4C99|nr:uncharacterized protein LOC133308716 [Gastrolobium bilobum]